MSVIFRQVIMGILLLILVVVFYVIKNKIRKQNMDKLKPHSKSFFDNPYMSREKETAHVFGAGLFLGLF